MRIISGTDRTGVYPRRVRAAESGPVRVIETGIFPGPVDRAPGWWTTPRDTRSGKPGTPVRYGPDPEPPEPRTN
jgi:hypothetical protein